jgi:hypothetical protein
VAVMKNAIPHQTGSKPGSIAFIWRKLPLSWRQVCSYAYTFQSVEYMSIGKIVAGRRSTFKMKTARFSEMLISTYKPTRRYKTEDIFTAKHTHVCVCVQGRTDTYGRLGQANNLAPLQTSILYIFVKPLFSGDGENVFY